MRQRSGFGERAVLSVLFLAQAFEYKQVFGGHNSGDSLPRLEMTVRSPP